MFIHGITHIALDVASPSRMERYLRDVFGLQTLRRGYWHGEHIRVVGSPHYQTANPGLIVLYLRPGIPSARIHHIAFGVREMSAESAVAELEGRGIYVDQDGGDMLYAPEDFTIKVDSFDSPRSAPVDDPLVLMEDLDVDENLPCMARAVHHVGLDVSIPTRMQDWLCDTFEFDAKRRFQRRGEFISQVYYKSAPTDPGGRKPGLVALFQRRGLASIRLNHIAFDVADANAEIAAIESRGAKVDLGGDAIIHGPEDVWFQLTSSDTPFLVGHPVNDPGPGDAEQVQTVRPRS